MICFMLQLWFHVSMLLVDQRMFKQQGLSFNIIHLLSSSWTLNLKVRTDNVLLSFLMTLCVMMSCMKNIDWHELAWWLIMAESYYTSNSYCILHSHISATAYNNVTLTVWQWRYGWYNFCRRDVCGQWCDRSIHHHVSHELDQLLCTILGLAKLEQLWVLINEVGVHDSRSEFLMTKHIQQEWGIGLKKNKLKHKPEIFRAKLGRMK